MIDKIDVPGIVDKSDETDEINNDETLIQQ